MRIGIDYDGVEKHQKLIESEIRDLTALQQEIERLIRLIDLEPGSDIRLLSNSLEPGSDTRLLRNCRDSVKELIMSARRRQIFLNWLSDCFRNKGKNRMLEISEVIRKLFTD